MEFQKQNPVGVSRKNLKLETCWIFKSKKPVEKTGNSMKQLMFPELVIQPTSYRWGNWNWKLHLVAPPRAPLRPLLPAPKERRPCRQHFELHVKLKLAAPRFQYQYLEYLFSGRKKTATETARRFPPRRFRASAMANNDHFRRL